MTADAQSVQRRKAPTKPHGMQNNEPKHRWSFSSEETLRKGSAPAAASGLLSEPECARPDISDGPVCSPGTPRTGYVQRAPTNTARFDYTNNCPTKRFSEPEPAGSPTDKSTVSGGWLRSLTFTLGENMQSNDKQLREMQDNIRARSDSELLEILDDKSGNWTPEAVSFAKREAEARPGLYERWERQQTKKLERERQEREQEKQARQLRERQEQELPTPSSTPSTAPKPSGSAMVGSTGSRPRADGTSLHGSDDGANSVVTRLKVIGGFIKIVWAIIGLVIGWVLGGAVVEHDARTVGASVGSLIGCALGYLIGFFIAVFIDWLREILILQEKTYHAVSKGRKG